MTNPTKQLLFWAPRVLGILFTVWVSIFALDVFPKGYGFGGTLLAPFMHLIPAMIVLTAVVIAWHWEAVGGVLLIALGVWYLITSWGRFHWSAFLAISGPLCLTGGLFLTDRAYQARLLHRI